MGREISSFAEGSLDSLANEGVDLFTTIDLELQAYCESLLLNKRGSIVAIEPSSGEILSMASSPGYDPNLLNLDEDRGKAFRALTENKEQKPLLDRSISARYPPGSIFKPILSLIALQEGVINHNQYVPCDGQYHYKTFDYGCHNHPPPFNVQTALEHSCNSYFFAMVRMLIEKEGFNNPKVGLNILRKHLYDFGLGQKTGVDIGNEVKGFVPTPEYYDGLYRNEINGWKSTYIMSIGIGQGELQLTTIQMANLAAIISNRGYYIRPHLVKGFGSPDIQVNSKYQTKNYVNIDSIHFQTVITGMKRVISGGTGYKAYLPGVEICGKTGTSQNSQGEDHSVFFAFAPKDNPKIAIAAYIENAGAGGNIAAPISSLVIEKYINKEVKREILENQIRSLNLIDKP